MKRLTEIGIKTNTDKATHHTFTEAYDTIFSNYTSPRILEIGVFNRESIDMYIEYFDKPYIVGMDNQDKSHLVNNDWKFVRGDQSNVADLRRCVDGEDKFDIILDDGGHTMKQQQVSFGYLINHVKSGGYYILEDLHTSYRQAYIESDCEFTTIEMLNRIIAKEPYFSNYICKACQQNILDKIESVEIWAKNKNNLTDNLTSIIKIK